MVVSSILTRGALSISGLKQEDVFAVEDCLEKKTILLLEDDRTMVLLLGRVLSLEGYEAVTSDGYEKEMIIRKITEVRPDAIFLDVHLNGIDGIELLGEIHSAEVEFHSKILMTSGLDMRQECLSAGADGFIMKPFIPSELINWLGRNLEEDISD